MQVMYTIVYTVQIGDDQPTTARLYLADEDTAQGQERVVSFGKGIVLSRYAGRYEPDIDPPLTISSNVVEVKPITFHGGYGPIRTTSPDE